MLYKPVTAGRPFKLAAATQQNGDETVVRARWDGGGAPDSATVLYSCSPSSVSPLLPLVSLVLLPRSVRFCVDKDPPLPRPARRPPQP